MNATLGPHRFQCLACGACCHGVRVELVSDDEKARIRGFAAEMGLPDPVDGDWLQQDGGRCRFQQGDGLCGIHARYGEPAKPSLCRQFPYVVVDTEQGRREGIDPSSFNLLATWETAPEVTDFHGEPRRSMLDPGNARAEAAILAWCAPGASIASVLGRLCAAPGHAPDLPPGFASRCATRLKAMRLDVLVQARDGGPAQREALAPLVTFLDGLDPENPPPWPVLTPREDAFAVEVTRRMVFLRLASRIPIVQAVALLTLTGAVGIAWATPDPERFGPAMASWSRLLRGGTFWQSLAPDPPTLQWLATG